MTVTGETADRSALDAPPSTADPDGLFFGGVVINKRYGRGHLMPVDVFPDLLAKVSAPLPKRIHGRSCFDFTKLDEALNDELAALTRRGFKRYQGVGIVKS